MAVARKDYFGYALEPILRKVFQDQYAALPTMIPDLYTMKTTTRPVEKDVHIGAMGRFPEFKGTIEYDRPYQGYYKIYEFPQFAKGFAVERQLYDDDQQNIIMRMPKQLAIQANRRREEDAAEVFNTAATEVGFDGKPLCAIDHPTPAPDGPPARSNKHTLELNHQNLQYVKTQMRKTVDDRGNKISVVPNLLLVSEDLEETAWQLVKSPGKLGQHDASTNPSIHEGRYTLLVWDALEDPDAWFLIDSHYMKDALVWWDRVKIDFAMTEDFDTLQAKYRAYMRYSCGYSDWIWVHGSSPNWA